MSQEKYFHFTIGPVQGFVAQARRTRDFWAGSFLLSWLSGVAMAEIIRQGGKINFPVPPDGYLDWITKGHGSGEKPRQGAIPNRFKAVQAQVPAGFDGAKVKKCVQEAWFALAEHIWEKDGISKIATKAETRIIWERQNKNFWDISWVLTKDDTDTSLMDQRKNWRNHYAEAGEPGVKCMVMDGWQELSGAERPGKEGNSFWKEIREDAKRTGIKTDLGEKEQLCALAYVKRRFARHFGSFNNKKLESGLTVNGWKLETGMPSVSYMAAVHWLENIIKTTTPEDAYRLLDAAKKVNPSQDEWDTRIECLKKIVENKGEKWDSGSNLRKLLSLDASVFFEHVQDNPKSHDFDERAMKNLISEMEKMKGLSKPSPFYAILLMDGDSLGKHMSDKDKQKYISESLNKFTHAVPEIVEKYNGFLIYAGGDDVLAILPLEDAIPCAASVRELYLKSFEGTGIPTTISAAIEFAHVKMPLGKVLGDSHHLLDDIAKEGAGRDALAVRVWKQSGMALEWAQPWEIVIQNGEIQIDKIAKDFVKNDEAVGNGNFSNKFFFKIRERFDLLNPAKEGDDAILNGKEAIELLAVDYVNSADNREKVSIEQAHSIIKPLLEQCRAVKRSLDESDSNKWERSHVLKADAALLVRFLIQKGVER